ncbi:hypothetical protein KP509_01G123900 [Ceratopteris richardii]|uniref:Uncharacterized protein n=1 Tax=Ceratopteris richardii TaxID=49495 RepID=A0A8T2VKS0_CERRI|nr:hypothetical protein KP509_01G123900 [Ceratopteris richardii]
MDNLYLDNATAKSSSGAKSNAINEASHRDKTSESTMFVSINDRKVKVGPESDGASLYALCRRWLKNNAPRKEQPGIHNFVKLPKPLPAKKLSESSTSIEENESEDNLEDYLEGEIEAPDKQELLDNHIAHFKNVRKRLREQHKQRIERYKIRLALLLQPNPYEEKVDAPLQF